VKVAEIFTSDLFKDLPINDRLKQVLAENNFETLTKVQKASIPAILANQNVVLKSETGSGKTLAYLVPLIEYLYQYSIDTRKIWRSQGAHCIIFSPTRELCVQIELELEKLLKQFSFIVPTTIMGGENP